MSQKYKHLVGMELIREFCTQVLIYGLKNNLDVTGIKIWLPPKLKIALNLGDFLTINYQQHVYNISVVTRNIKEIPLGNGKFQTDIFVWNPEWETTIDDDCTTDWG